MNGEEPFQWDKNHHEQQQPYAQSEDIYSEPRKLMLQLSKEIHASRYIGGLSEVVRSHSTTSTIGQVFVPPRS
jgi:hypothetical protein